LETSCFQPDSAAVFREDCLPARLESVLCLKAKSLGCLSGLKKTYKRSFTHKSERI